jgi:acetyl-CoA carboxylase biotin carboxyl carrier protein
MGEAVSLKKATEKTDTEMEVGKGGKKSAKASSSFNLDEIKQLAALVEEHGFVDFEFENANIRVHMRKQLAPVMSTAPAVHHVAAPVAEAKPAAAPIVETPHPGAKAETEAAADEGLHKITSPIVGTFYHAPSPDSPVFVKVGDSVSDDTVVCIIEAMKLMNEIQAEVSGEVVKVYVENGQPVEFGQPLFGIKK